MNKMFTNLKFSGRQQGAFCRFLDPQLKLVNWYITFYIPASM